MRSRNPGQGLSYQDMGFEPPESRRILNGASAPGGCAESGASLPIGNLRDGILCELETPHEFTKPLRKA